MPFPRTPGEPPFFSVKKPESSDWSIRTLACYCLTSCSLALSLAPTAPALMLFLEHARHTLILGLCTDKHLCPESTSLKVFFGSLSSFKSCSDKASWIRQTQPPHLKSAPPLHLQQSQVSLFCSSSSPCPQSNPILTCCIICVFIVYCLPPSLRM